MASSAAVSSVSAEAVSVTVSAACSVTDSVAGTVSAGAEAVPQPIMEINSAHARDRDRYFFSVFFITFTFRCSFNNTTVL